MINAEMQSVLIAAIDSADTACREIHGCRDGYDCRECKLLLEGCITRFVAERLLEQFDIAAKERDQKGAEI